MTGRPSSYIAQEWSVHAQLTISHHRPDVEVTPPTPQSDNGVHMEYSWNTIPTTSAASLRPCYGFQRGNIVFTTRPSNISTNPTQRPDQGFRDSGYLSEHISPGVYGSLPTRRPTQPYNRRCKSTCSITLSTDHVDGSAGPSKPTVSRSHSLNTPTPCDHTIASEKGIPTSKKVISPVHEVCEVCGGERSPSSLRRATNYTTHFCTRVPDKTQVVDVSKQSQDASSQTHDETKEDEAVNSVTASSSLKCDEAGSATGSDCLKVDEAVICVKAPGSKPAQPRMGNKAVFNTRRKSVTDLLQIPSVDLPEETPTEKPVTRLSRSPARLSGKSPLIASRKSSSRSPNSKSQVHKPRTVHIDVYCTGSDASDSSSSSSLDSNGGASWSSPQTVFESEKVRVVHTRAGKDRLPQALLQHAGGSGSLKSQSMKVASSKEETSTRGYDSEDGLSSWYPSQFSSYTSIRDSSPSRDPSSSTISSSSCALSDEYDSAAATSWKDTATDLDSLSLLHSNLSLAQSDSFEYADSIDRLRIRQRERAWAAGQESKTWRSPQSERRHMIQQQKLKEFLEKRLTEGSFPLWKAGKSDESEDDGDETGDAWSFGGDSSSKVSTLKREDTVRKATPSNLTTLPPPPPQDPEKDTSKALFSPTVEFDALSDTSPHVPLRRVIFPFSSRSPSPAPTKVESTIMSPFTTRVGLRTDQLSRAEKFGTIVGAFRKPGHHIGPSKNPDCSCAHCRNYYFEQNECRGRTRSLDISLEAADNWKMQLQKQITDKKNASLGENIEELRKYEDQWEDSAAV